MDYDVKHLLRVALDLVSEKQGDQYDKLGKPYILHLFNVTTNATHIVVEENIDLSLYNNSIEELMILGLLHDVIEDTDTTIEDLVELGFPKHGCIIRGLKLITRPPKSSGISYYDYIRTIRDSDNLLVKIIKRADLSHNMQKDRVQAFSLVDPVKSKSLEERYKKALSILNYELD